MSIEFKLPELGENIESGDVLRVLVSVGDNVTKEQPVLEVETGKAVVEVPSSVEGKVVSVNVSEGETVKVGQAVMAVEGVEIGESKPSMEPPNVAGTAQAATANRAMTEADEPAGITPEMVQEPASEKETVEPVQSAAQASAQAAPPPQAAPSPPAAPAPAAEGAEAPARAPVMAAPSIRQFARELGVDVHDVQGSGPGGRVSIEDVKLHVRRSAAQAPDGAAAAVSAPRPGAAVALPDFSAFGPVNIEPMSAVRLATAEHMGQAWSTVPHVTQFDTADMTELEALRKRYQARVEAASGKLTITAILLKITAAALRRFPKVNSSIDMASRSVIYKSYFHIGVAVDTERGLLVPVIRDVDKKSLVDLSIELGQIAEKARERKVRPEDLQGGCFTITNLGGMGGKHFAPIINHPEVAILGVGRGTTQPAYIDGELQPRLMLPLALSYDHRLIDGADGTRFLRWIVEAIEQPFLLSLEG